MSNGGGGRQAPDPADLPDQELRATIAALEAEREAREAECRVLRRRIALLRAERLARARDAHFDPGAVADALMRRLPGLAELLARRRAEE